VRVLVIDDEPDVLLLCRVNLEFAGHEVLEAADGERGLELATSSSPDLIVLDIMLPGIDGFSVLRTLGEHPKTKDTPVVLLTAKSQVEDQISEWRGGCSGYVTKPFAPTTLTETVEALHRMSPDERLARREREIGRLEGRA
jgi:DNA-binding response OmpR family regulator